VTPEILEFLKQCPPRTSVLEVGARNINGSARSVVQHKHWLGTDMIAGDDVDMVCMGENLPKYFGPIFDGGVIAECLEHCENWKAVLYALYACIKPGGIICITTPGVEPMFPKHDYPNDYWRFTRLQWRQVFTKCTIIADADFYYPHNGNAIIVAKTGPMDLDIEVASVPA
jgi:SAM-dependent methyltransferase